jgi:hypothetical protein
MAEGTASSAKDEMSNVKETIFVNPIAPGWLSKSLRSSLVVPRRSDSQANFSPPSVT